MSLTSRGWTVAGTTLGLYVGGRVLGVVELSMLAAAGLATLVLAAAVAALGRPALDVVRRLHPHRLYAGTPAHAEIVVRNRGTRRTSLLAVSDRFTGRREARFAVPPVAPGAHARGAFRLPTARRGLYEIGPLEVACTDPLGLIRRPLVTEPREPLTVYPRIETVRALPLTAGRDLVGGAVRDYSRSRAGEEFHGLREYAQGDDLRRVHWRSTARTGQLMIREHDVPWQTRATLLVDDRTSCSTSTSFERVVEAAASVATALHQRGSIVRLLTTAAGETAWGSGHDHHRLLMERLAVVERSPGDALQPVAARLHRQTASGALVVFAGDLPVTTVEMLATLGRRYGVVVVVRFAGSAAAPPSGGVPGIVTVDVGQGASFADAWNAAMISRGRQGSRGRPAARRGYVAAPGSAPRTRGRPT